MKLVVDTNIVFSGILNTEGNIGDLLINSEPYFSFISPEFLRTELSRNKLKLSRASGLSNSQLKIAVEVVLSRIRFIPEGQIRFSAWKAADHLCHDVDPGDTPFVALARHARCRIWSGDKQLMKALSTKGYTQFHSTGELLDLRERLRKG